MKQGQGLFQRVDKKVRGEGFAIVDLQIGQIKRPEVMPLWTESCTIDQVERDGRKRQVPWLLATSFPKEALFLALFHVRTGCQNSHQQSGNILSWVNNVWMAGYLVRSRYRKPQPKVPSPAAFPELYRVL